MQGGPYVVRPRAQRAFSNTPLCSHTAVMRSLVVALIEVIVHYQLALLSGEKLETLQEALMPVALDLPRSNGFGEAIGGYLFSSPGFTNDIAGHPMKVTNRIATVCLAEVRQSLHDAVDGFVRKIFRVTKPLGDEDPYQACPDDFIFPTRDFTIRV